MGRKKKGKLSHEQLVKNIVDKSSNEIPVKITEEPTADDELLEENESEDLATKMLEPKPKKSTRKAKLHKKVSKVHQDKSECEDEVFEENTDKVNEDMDELTINLLLKLFTSPLPLFHPLGQKLDQQLTRSGGFVKVAEFLRC